MSYKKHFLSLIIFGCMLFSSALSAQKGLFVSLKGMPQVSVMHVKDSYKDDEHTVDYYFGNASGIEMGYNFNDTIGLGLEVLFSNEGNRYRYSAGSTYYDIRERYKYVKIPIQVVISGNSSKPISFRAKMGPSFNFLREADIYYFSNIAAPRNREDENFKTVSISWAMNLGVAFNVTDFFSIDTGVRSDYSLTSARKEYSILNPPYELDGKNYRPFSLAFEVGARFKF